MKSKSVQALQFATAILLMSTAVCVAMSGELSPADQYQKELAEKVRKEGGDMARPLPANNPHIDLYSSNVWAARWPNARIFVCWEEGNNDDEGKRWTEEAVTETWQRHSALVFTGWKTCAAGNAGIRIKVADVGPNVKELGRFLDGLKDGMVLNFTFDKWSPGCKAQRESCIKVIAVHEFGHALSFAHEQNRPDAPGECKEQTQGTNPDTLLTPYDKQSVMDYCNKKWANDGVLSELDIDAVKKLYGASTR